MQKVGFIMENTPSDTCKNCQAPLTGAYCSQCGQKTIQRITLRTIFQEFWQALIDLDQGVLFTIKALVQNPGKAVTEYLNGRTRPYTPPLRFALVLTTIQVLLSLWTGAYETQTSEISSLFAPSGEDQEEIMKNQQQAMEWMRPYLNILPLLLIPFYAYFYRLFFRKYTDLNFAEHMVIGAFMQGIISLFGIFIFTPLLLIAPSADLSLLISFIMYIGLFSWTYRYLAKTSWLRTGIYVAVGFLIGYLLLLLIMFVLGIIAVLALALLGVIDPSAG